MPHTNPTRGRTRLAIVGAGRLGTALASQLRTRSQFELIGPLGRGAGAAGCEAVLAGCRVVLLCVPDREIATAASAVPPGPVLGHCSGATGLEPLAPHEAFSLHPLMTVSDTGADFRGATAVIDATTDRALDLARLIAQELKMDAVRVAPEDRVAYHAAASIASNFLVTLEAAAERLAGSAGVTRQMLAPLVRATVENWVTLGAERALTGPVARGDQATVAGQRHAVGERSPELLPLFDALTAATQELSAP